MLFRSPGGGRYFNAAKQLTQANSTNKTDVDATTSNPESVTSSSVVEEANATQSTSAPNGEVSSSTTSLSAGLYHTPLHTHLPVNSQDFKLHQFFSLHRPLLTLSQPTSSLFEPPTIPFSLPPAANAEAARFGTIDDPPEASPESDADAARLLARALVSNKVGAALAWEETLRRLGLDESKGDAEEVNKAQVEFDMYMDSTKRKRRKKMKKHKYVPRAFLLFALSLMLSSAG